MASGGQSVDYCPHGDAGHVHGGARHQHRQRRTAAYRRQSFGGSGREHLGAHVLSRLQCHRAAAERLALFDRRAQELLHGLCRPVHRQFVSVRIRSQSRHADRLPYSSGCGRRRIATERAVHPRRYFRSRQTRHGIRRVRHRRGHGSGHWSDARGLDHRQLYLALDFLHQYSGRDSLAVTHLAADSGSAIPQAPQAERDANRLHRARFRRAWPRNLAGDPRQRAARRLVRIQLHPMADGGFGRVADLRGLLGVAA